MSDLPTLAAPPTHQGRGTRRGGYDQAGYTPPTPPHLAKGHNCPNSL